MNNNDVLRSLRYALDLSDPKLLTCFANGQQPIAAARLMAMLKQEEAPGYEVLEDRLFDGFLNGFVEHFRGKRDAAEAPAPLAVNNNRILRSIKIALELKDTDIIAVMSLTGFVISKAEVNALFRRESHANFQPCGNQFLRNFLRGLAIKHRGAAPE